MPNSDNHYYINRIRLINFHNFVNETIEVKNGGHLFLLGDNGSGKTTVLDAIHYVLTAGECMEFNSAARVAGSKEGGRRPQGIITRYNVDTGHLNPNGGITYAALEIIGRHGRPSTVAIGMSVASPNENLKRWGIVRECTLEEIPFLREEDGKLLPLNSVEMKKALKGTGFHGQINAYKKQLAERFTGGMEPFGDFCHFLSMGKAYREIVSHSSDYHALFKKLLPQPNADIFEKIVDSLKTLDSSRGDMENLVRKHNYIRELKNMLEEIGQQRRESDIHHTIALQLETLANDKEISQKKRRINDLKKQQLELENSCASLKNTEAAVTAELDDCKAQDASGILRQEQELLARVKTMRTKVSQCHKSTDGNSDMLEQLKNNIADISDKIRKTLRQLQDSLTGFDGKADIPLSTLIAAIDEQLHKDRPEKKIGSLPVPEILDKAREEINRLARQKHTCETTLENLFETEEELNLEIIELEGSPEAEPEVRYFSDAVKELNTALVDFLPLYKGLEWSRKAKGVARSSIEEFIGQNILGTILVADEDYDRAAEIILKEFPGIRVTRVLEKHKASKDFLAWAGNYFDLKKSEAACMYVLEQELSAQAVPEMVDNDGIVSVNFRNHSYSLIGYDPCLIGSENRRNIQAAKLQERQEELDSVSRDIKELQDQIKNDEKKSKATVKFTSTVEKAYRELAELCREFDAAQLTVTHKQELYDSENRRYDELSRELSDGENRLKQLQQIIKKQNLHDLDRRIKELSARLQECRQTQEQAFAGGIKTRQQLENLGIDLENTEKRGEELKQLYQQSLEHLQATWQLESTDEFVTRTRTDERLRLPEDARNIAENHRSSSFEKQGLLRARLTEPEFGGVWAFTYDEAHNRLFDRNNIMLEEIEAEQYKNLTEQRTLINEKTGELFKKIIVTELVSYLREKQSRLKEMVKSINSRLENRMFGNNCYHFQITPVDKYRQLEKIIGKYAFYDDGCERELHEFFDDHRAEIIAAEVGEIPEILDYRNWYHYDMRVTTPGHDGKVMDRHIKSIGSGGEQAVPNYLLILTIAHFLYHGSDIKLYTLLFDEAFYGIDAQRRDQLMGFASDLDLQLFVASPDQDGVKREIAHSTSILVVKDKNYDVHLFPFHWTNPEAERQEDLFITESVPAEIAFTEELATVANVPENISTKPGTRRRKAMVKEEVTTEPVLIPETGSSVTAEPVTKPKRSRSKAKPELIAAPTEAKPQSRRKKVTIETKSDVKKVKPTTRKKSEQTE